MTHADALAIAAVVWGLVAVCGASKLAQVAAHRIADERRARRTVRGSLRLDQLAEVER